MRRGKVGPRCFFVWFVNVFELERLQEGLTGKVDDRSQPWWVVLGLVGSPCQLCGVVGVFLYLECDKRPVVPYMGEGDR
jgi:hypothetical protein